MPRHRPCPTCGRAIVVLQIFDKTLVVDADRRCYRVARDPGTGVGLVQEAPGCYPEHECATLRPKKRSVRPQGEQPADSAS